MMCPGYSSPSSRGEADAQQLHGFRICLTISGLHCASEGAPLERALRKILGVRDATVNPLRDRVSIVVDALTRIDAVVRLLAARGYPVDPGEIYVTAWLNGIERLRELKRELLASPGVTSCNIAEATSRVDLRLKMIPGWEAHLRAVCDQLCAATAAQETITGTAPDQGNRGNQGCAGYRAQPATDPTDK